MTSYVDYVSVPVMLLVAEKFMIGKYKKNLPVNLTQKLRNTYSKPC